jgi:hypothetical protein
MEAEQRGGFQDIRDTDQLARVHEQRTEALLRGFRTRGAAPSLSSQAGTALDSA